MADQNELDRLYREAQSALKAKEYDRAAGLLTQILVIDENYKDVSRLLAQTVKLKRRRWYNDGRIWGTAFGAVVIGLLIWIVPKLSSLRATPAAEIVNLTGTAISTNATTSTITPSPMPTPIPLVWKRVSIGQDFERDTITAITTDPKDQDVLYASMKNAGIYKSIDGGLSWRPAHYGLTNTHVVSLLIDFQNPQVLYAGTLSGIFKTEDGGESWYRIGEGTHLLMDPQDSSHLYARDNDNIYESTDHGKNWKTANSTKEGCPDRIRSWAIHPVESKTLFIVGGEECEPGLYLSSDGGKTWTLEEKGGFCTAGLSVGLDRQGNYFIIETCGLEYSYFLPLPTFDSVYSYWDSDSHLYKENLNGEQRLTLGKPDVGFVRVIAISPDDPDTLYVGGEGIAVSRDGGLTWTKLNNGLGSGVLQLNASSGDIPILYIQSGECDEFLNPEAGWDIKQSLYISTDSGITWDFANQIGCRLIMDADGSTLYRIGKSHFGGQHEGWIWRSPDGGKSWQKIITPSKVITLTTSQIQNGSVYIYTEKWESWVSQQYVSEDYGHKWRAKDPLIDIKTCHGSTPRFIDAYRPMTIDPFDGNHVFVIDNGALLESRDSCKTTSTFATAPNTNINTIAFDASNPDMLYAGTDGGAYISYDGGATWGQVNDGLLGAVVVYSIVVDKDSNVYAATPYGIFKLENK